LRQKFLNLSTFRKWTTKMVNFLVILDCYETSQVQNKISSLIFSSQKQLVIKSLARAQNRIRQARLANPPFRYQNSGLQKKHFCIKEQSKNKRPVKFYASGTLFSPYPVRRKSIVCQRKFTSWSYFLDEPDIDSISIFMRNSKLEM